MNSPLISVIVPVYKAEDLLDHLQNKNQRLFAYTGLVHTYARTRAELENQVMQIISTARSWSVDLSTLAYRQREGLNSVLPLGNSLFRQQARIRCRSFLSQFR